MRRPTDCFFAEPIPKECCGAILGALDKLNKKISEYGVQIDGEDYVLLSFTPENEDGVNQYAKLSFRRKHKGDRWRDVVEVLQTKEDKLETILLLNTFPQRRIDIADTPFPNLFEYKEKEEKQ